MFLNQQELQAQRSQCDISRKASGTEAVSPAGGTVTLRYVVSNGRVCLSGAASDSTWANVSRADESQASVVIEPNDSATPRETTVTVVSRNGRSAAFRISQPAGNGFRAIEPQRTATSP
ncbi:MULTISPECIES: BACON domain-containing protein [unclassified Variovorax]|uniref:BACON domain-containing protein n=1 Tax=unclassified Variovorax TaxID=663243 RepID=UPI00076D5247|nr:MULTISPECIES: BACON domain-containing protein [unclassified Variovorax]KWT98358.1 hypothetical protein APY03_0493 [Variovorax sp. WDL1]